MERHVRQIYLQEAITQCDFALNALRGLNNVLPRIGSAASESNFRARQTLHQEVFRSIHSFLTHSSNISRLFWPARPRKREGESSDEYAERCAATTRIARSRALRVFLELPDAHALRNRELRNHLEHFDERLDDWEATSERHNFVQDFIGPRNAIVGIDESDMMRWFDPSTRHMRFRGEEYDLQELATAVEELRNRCLQAVERDDREAREEIRGAHKAGGGSNSA